MSINTTFTNLNEAESALKPGQLIAVVSESDSIKFAPIDARIAEIGNGVIALMGGHPHSMVCETNRMMALEYAKAGIYVFPVSGTDRKPKSDKPNSEKLAKRPCYGVKWSDESTKDSRTIIEWWRKWPDSLIGIDMGKSGLVAIDVDRQNESMDGVEALKN